MYRWSKRLGMQVWVDTPKRKPSLDTREQKNLAHMKEIYLGCNTGKVKYYPRLNRRMNEVCAKVDRICGA